MSEKLCRNKPFLAFALSLCVFWRLSPLPAVQGLADPPVRVLPGVMALLFCALFLCLLMVCQGVVAARLSMFERVSAKNNTSTVKGFLA